MRHRSRTKIVAAVVPVALVVAVSQVPSASAAAAGRDLGDRGRVLQFRARVVPQIGARRAPQAHLTAVRTGSSRGPSPSRRSTDGLPYQYKFATNDDWSNPNFGLQGGSGNAVLRVPAGGASVTFVFDPATNLGSDSINSVALAGNFQTQLGCPANDDKSCPQSWLYDIDGDGVYTLATGSISAGTYQVSAITGLGTGDDASGRRRSPCRRPAAAPPRPSASHSATNEVSTIGGPAGAGAARHLRSSDGPPRGRHRQPLVMELEVRRPGMHHGARAGRVRRRPGRATGELDQQPEQ